MESSSSIELKVMSGRDLKAFSFFQKLSVYVMVAIASDDPDKRPKQSQRQRTPTDKEGDGNPEWNHEMRFDLDEASIQDNDHLFIHFELHAEVVVLGDKNIGEVRVPFKDLIDEFNGVVRFVSYEVRGSDGKPNGVLNFSYKVNAKGKGNEIGGAAAAAALPVTNIDGYSVVHQPSPEALYPTLEVESCCLSSEGQYRPSMELSNPSQDTYLGPDGDHYNSPEVQHTSHETHHPPPYDIYYPPPPPPPPPHDIYYPPPPPHLLHHPHLHPGMHGPFYRPHRPPPIHPWEFASSYDSSGHGPGSPDVGRSERANNGERWPRVIGAERELYPPLWNGR